MNSSPSRARIIWAFAAVYIIWGSTYLAIRFAIETIPPFLMGGLRFLIAGAVLLAYQLLRGRSMPPARNWRGPAVSGLLMLMGGNGAVVWAEQYVASGVVALMVAVVPLWMVLLDWLWHRSGTPTLRVFLGITLGFAGLALLIGNAAVAGAGAVSIAGAAALVVGSLSWAVGSLYAKTLSSPGDPFQLIIMQMLAGGAGLVLLGMTTGELTGFELTAISQRSLLSLLYLAAFGSIVAFSAYVWLLGHVSPARVSTYAYVNPVVAVFLGWAFAGEPFTARMLLASAIILTGVAMITMERGTPPPGRGGRA